MTQMGAGPQVAEVSDPHAEHGLPPWQFFLLCGMLGATAVVVVATGQPIAQILVLSLTIVATSFVGLGAYRTLAPLVSQVFGGAPTVAGGRTRAALEREKALVLRSIKELEFDFAMGKVSQVDFDEMAGRLRRRAMGLMQRLDATSDYRERIEKELAALVQAPPVPRQTPAGPQHVQTAPSGASREQSVRGGFCASCGTPHDADARFCKQCGTSLTS